MKNFKKYTKNGLAFLTAFVLFILACYIFFAIIDNKEENDYYKPSVDKSVKNVQYDGQAYTNQKYKFQITFPQNWNVFTGNNPHILQKAENGENSIFVSIFEFDKSLFNTYSNLDELTIKDFFTPDEYKQLATKGIRQTNQITGITSLNFLEYFNTELNGIPAYGFKSSYMQNKNGETKEYTQINYDVMLGNIKYSITGIAPTKDFTSVQDVVVGSIKSFQLLGY